MRLLLAKRQSGVLLTTADHAGNADVHIRGFPLRAMLPLLLPCEFPKAESLLAGWLAGVWRSAGSGLLYTSWSGVEWSGRGGIPF